MICWRLFFFLQSKWIVSSASSPLTLANVMESASPFRRRRTGHVHWVVTPLVKEVTEDEALSAAHSQHWFLWLMKYSRCDWVVLEGNDGPSLYVLMSCVLKFTQIKGAFRFIWWYVRMMKKVSECDETQHE